jgi:hypothetical protein
MMNVQLPSGVVPGEAGWEVYQDAPRFTLEEASGVMPGDTSPEAAATHYLASRVRRDERFREVLPPEGHASLPRLMEKIKDGEPYGLNAFQLVRRMDLRRDRFYVKAAMEVQINPTRVKKLTDDLTVERVGDRWCVSSAPL